MKPKEQAIFTGFKIETGSSAELERYFMTTAMFCRVGFSKTA